MNYPMKNEKQKIESLQALRAIAFIGIFLNHAGAPFSWSALGVSVFFVLSGFLMFYKHGDDDMDLSLKSRAAFSWARIRKLYPLHILTMIFAVILELAVIVKSGIAAGPLLTLAGEIVLNITLLQTWVPNSVINVSLNGVAWYLSVTMFLYFVFPGVQRFIRSRSGKSLWIICLLIPVVQCAACIPFIILFGNESPVYIWFCYCFPVFRLGDFFIGCSLGRLYAESEFRSQSSATAFSAVEILVTSCTTIMCKWALTEQTNVILLSMQNWTTIYIPIAVVWIFLFTVKKGVISRLLSCKALIWLGNISAYAFLIHYVVTQYFNAAMDFLDITLDTPVKWVIILIEFAITIAATLIYKRIRELKR